MCIRVVREVIKESKDRRGWCVWRWQLERLEGDRQERRPSHNIHFRQFALSLPKHNPQYILSLWLQARITSIRKRKQEKSRGDNVCTGVSEESSANIQNSPHLSRGDPRRSQMALVQHLQPPVTHICPQGFDSRPKRFWALPLIHRTRRRVKC